ncbi:hypothetical protein [Nocardia sp. AG03]|uniref:hypothetical protein n=1 Tax=Nocardia sp. AG03 TaxID=3025312 RepID=UPI002418891D|nr:hypothetical protein [Nocardia sp. AG03]
MLAAFIAAATFGSALLAFAFAEGFLDNRRAQLLETGCRRDIPVPVAATAFTGIATGLLVVTGASLIWLLVLLFRYPSTRSAVAVPFTTLAFVVSALFLLGVGYETVNPDPLLPASSGYRPCGFG